MSTSAPVIPAAASAAPISGHFTEDAKSSLKIVGIVIAMLAIVFVTMYIVNMLKSNSLKQVPLLKSQVLQLDNRQNLPMVIPANAMATTTRGLEFAFNFWIYLSDTYDKTGNHKVIFQRGTDAILNGTALPTLMSDKAGPIVVMDKDTNRMMFAINTSFVKRAQSLNDIFARDPVSKRFSGPYLVTAIDYVPLQRWVNIALVIRDNTMMVYMDGDLYSIVTTSDVMDNTGKIPFIRMPVGDMTIGDPVSNIRGFAAKLNFYNYALTQNQIQKIYSQGPQTTSFLSYFGLTRYGLRSPFYNIDNSS